MKQILVIDASFIEVTNGPQCLKNQRVSLVGIVYDLFDGRVALHIGVAVRKTSNPNDTQTGFCLAHSRAKENPSAVIDFRTSNAAVLSVKVCSLMKLFAESRIRRKDGIKSLLEPTKSAVIFPDFLATLTSQETQQKLSRREIGNMALLAIHDIRTEYKTQISNMFMLPNKAA